MAESSRDEIAKLEALYANNPEGRVFTHLAEAYRKAGELDRARTILDGGLTRHAGYASAHVVLGRVLMDQQKDDEAAEAFRRVLDLDPHNRIALRSLGDIARSGGRTAAAREYFEELRHLDPNSDEIVEILQELNAAPPEIQAEPEASPEPEAAAEPEPAPEPMAETAGAEAPFEPDAYSAIPEPSFDEPASFDPSGDLGWMPDAEAQDDQALPGDLAGFAGLSSNGQGDFDEAASGDASNSLGDLDVSFGADEPEVVEEPFEFESMSLSGEPEPAAEADSFDTMFEPPVPDAFAEASAPDVTADVAGETPLFDAPAAEPDDVEELFFESETAETSSFELSGSVPDSGSDSDPDSDIDELFLEEPAAETGGFEEPVFAVPAAAADASAEPAFDDPFTDEPFANESVVDDPPAEEPEAGGEVVTETIAELYRSQQLYDRAADVYRALLLQRPDDETLRSRLAEVESLASSGSGGPAPTAQPDRSFDDTVFAASEPEAPAVESAPWILGASAAGANPPNPYAWSEKTPDAGGDDAPPIASYFESLLTWRPTKQTSQAAPAAPEASPEAPEAEMLLDDQVSGTDDFYTVDESADDPFAGQPAPPADDPWLKPASAAEPSGSMPWDIPAVTEPSTPQPFEAAPTAVYQPPEPAAREPEAAFAAPEPAAAPAPVAEPPRPPAPAQSTVPSGDSTTPEGAFDEWFGATEETADAAPAPSAPADDEPAPGDDDDDLEMFRSWLQSLKK